MRLKLLLLLPFFFILFSCTPKKGNTKDSSPDVSEGEAKADESPALTLTLSQSGSESGRTDTGNDNKEEGDAPEVIWDSFSGPLHLQSMKPTSYLLPDSLMIGPLSDPLSYTLAERDVYSLIMKFWEVFRQGRIPREFLSKNPHPLFYEEMEEFLESGSEIIALYPGSFRLTGASASMEVVLLSESGYIKAVIFMLNENELWSIEDWEMPFRNWPGEEVPREKDLLQRQSVL